MAKGSGTSEISSSRRIRRPEWLAEWALGESGRRSSDYFGQWKRTRRDVRPGLALVQLAELADATPPAEPKMLDEATGELAYRPDGLVSIWRSVDRVIRRPEWTAAYELAWIRWAARAGAITGARQWLARATERAAVQLVSIDSRGRFRWAPIAGEPVDELEAQARAGPDRFGLITRGWTAQQRSALGYLVSYYAARRALDAPPEVAGDTHADTGGQCERVNVVDDRPEG